jgi:hypothetical protein
MTAFPMEKMYSVSKIKGLMDRYIEEMSHENE